MLRRVTVRGAPCAELLGPDDLLRPWSVDVEATSSVPIAASFSVLAQARLAILDRAFAERMARWSELTEALLERVTDRTRRLTYNLAGQRSRRVDERLWLLLWQLADRWGVVGSHGVELHLPGYSHTVPGSLVAARRPSVTTAIGRLAERGLLGRLTDGGLVLLGEPSPEALRTARDSSASPLALAPQPAPARHRQSARHDDRAFADLRFMDSTGPRQGADRRVLRGGASNEPRPRVGGHPSSLGAAAR